jgi:hypothetical protein
MTAQTRAKIAGQWALAAAMYMLLYSGANDVLWPLLGHFHHVDWHVPALVDGAISSVLLPSLIAFLLTATLRVHPSPWPFLIAPVLLMAAMKYAGDAFYPPYRSEFLSLLVAGAIQGASAWSGWFLHTRMSRREQRVDRGDELHAQSI